MLFPALLASAVAIAVELPDRPEPGTHAARLAIVMDDGAVVVSRDHGGTGIVAARCPVHSTSIEDATGAPRTHNLDDALEAEAAPPSAASPATSNATPGEPAESLQQDLGTHGCEQPRPAAQVAWFGGALYLACTGGPLLRWREDTGLWPVLLAPAAPESAPAQHAQALPERVVAMTAGAQLWLVDAGQELWASPDGEGFRQLGPVPEPAVAIAEWSAAVITAGATAIWQRTDAEPSWQPLLTMRACALAAQGDALWLAGPAGLIEMTRERARVHLVAPLTGAAARDGILWLASGHGPVVHASRDAVASVRLPGPRDPEPDGDPASAAAAAGQLQQARSRARWARWLPDVTAQARWSRARSQRAMLSEPPWPDPDAARSHDAAFLIWLTWSLGNSGSAFGPATRSWP